jgi:hypothetical protein
MALGVTTLGIMGLLITTLSAAFSITTLCIMALRIATLSIMA